MTGTRILTALVLLPVVVGTVLFLPTSVVALLTVVVTLLALNEFFAIGERAGMKSYALWTMICATALIERYWASGAVRMAWISRHFGESDLVDRPVLLPPEAVLVAFALGCAVFALLGRKELKDVLNALSLSAAGMLFVALPLSSLVQLHAVERLGPRLVLFVLCLVWAGDTVAYFVGRSIGRLPMAPQISPKKTWEGAAGNILGSVLVAYPFARWMQVDLLSLAAVAAAANIAGQLGDLVESAYKRSAGAKDSGTILPGHGGMLDRIDSLIFAAPVVWYYVSIVLRART